jgi:hypothetical protein
LEVHFRKAPALDPAFRVVELDVPGDHVLDKTKTAAPFAAWLQA